MALRFPNRWYLVPMIPRVSTRWLPCLLSALCSILPLVTGAEGAFERAYEADAFILAHNGESRIKIGVDTTDPAMLRLAMDLQETLKNLGGARPPLQHPVTAPEASPSGSWNLITFVPHWPGAAAAVQTLPARYTVSMEYLQPGHSINCLKRLRIDYRQPEDARDALSWVFQEFCATPFPAPNTQAEPHEALSFRVHIPESSLDVVQQELKTSRRDTASARPPSKRRAP